MWSKLWTFLRIVVLMFGSSSLSTYAIHLAVFETF
jgi:hypothetical protein